MTEHAALLISSGQGPGECRQAVAHLCDRLHHSAEAWGLALDMVQRPARHGPSSAVVTAAGPQADTWANEWTGVVLWRCPSALRPSHKRRNWFVQVFVLPPPPTKAVIAPADVRIQTLRAGGPGGQHQNTTDSAVRARWTAPDGLSLTVTVRSERSQHQNRRLALDRLAHLAAHAVAEAEASAAQTARGLHHQLQRGAPRHVFTGPGFDGPVP